MRYNHIIVEKIDFKGDLERRYSDMQAHSDGEYVKATEYDKLQIKYDNLKADVIAISEKL